MAQLSQNFCLHTHYIIYNAPGISPVWVFMNTSRDLWKLAMRSSFWKAYGYCQGNILYISKFNNTFYSSTATDLKLQEFSTIHCFN